ncbi:hypothetical protein BC830DRAFT_229172 [Chytriomyces sp. MP71]|nr:hypothetical protein BC830DRAFT_229172 [Chytriomyces sp. MP71]
MLSPLDAVVMIILALRLRWRLIESHSTHLSSSSYAIGSSPPQILKQRNVLLCFSCATRPIFRIEVAFQSFSLAGSRATGSPFESGDALPRA